MRPNLIDKTDGARRLGLVIYLCLAMKSLPEKGKLCEVDALAPVLVALADQGLGLPLTHGATNLRNSKV